MVKLKSIFLLLLVYIILIKVPFVVSQAQDEKAKLKEFVTKSFTLPAAFRNSGPDVVDPFADDSIVPPHHPQKVLEKAGISFPPGASARFIPTSNVLIVRNTKEQMELVDAYLEIVDHYAPNQIKVINEFIEVDRKLFDDWMFQNRITIDGTEFRKTVQKWVKAGRGNILDTTIVSARSGNRAKVESIREFIYPTEFVPAELPAKVNLNGPDSKAPITSGNGTAFEVRNLGITVEVDPVIQADGETIDLNVAPEMVKLDGYTHWPPKNGDALAAHKMPQFYTIKTVTQVRIKDGRYAFIGTHRPLKSSDPDLKNPIVLHFVRADIENIPFDENE